MPVTHSLQGRLVTITCVGSYSPDQLMAELDVIIASPQRPQRPALLLDLCASESVLTRSIDDLRRIAAYFVRHAELFERRVALLVTGHARYGLMRMTTAWLESDTINARVFRDPDQARAWLLTDDPAHDESDQG